MEQGNWNVDEMLHWLDMKINREDRDIREQSKKMNGNFLHFFEWNAESLYKSHFMSGCYKILRQAVDGQRAWIRFGILLRTTLLTVRTNC